MSDLYWYGFAELDRHESELICKASIFEQITPPVGSSANRVRPASGPMLSGGS